jgi:hypothetical protein
MQASERDAARCGGQPVVARTRIRVATILTCYRQGMSIEEIVQQYTPLKQRMFTIALVWWPLCLATLGGHSPQRPSQGRPLARWPLPADRPDPRWLRNVAQIIIKPIMAQQVIPLTMEAAVASSQLMP